MHHVATTGKPLEPPHILILIVKSEYLTDSALVIVNTCNMSINLSLLLIVR